MAGTFLIDGYNLMHVLGFFPSQVSPQSLHKSRLRLLNYLSPYHLPRGDKVTIVFDAHTPKKDPVQVIAGIEILFAVDYPEADDLLEELICGHASPKQLTVVSNDHRLQRAARRRKAVAWSCDDYLENLPRQALHMRQESSQEDAQKPLTDLRRDSKEFEHWMETFGYLNEDADAKELFDPFGFHEEDV